MVTRIRNKSLTVIEASRKIFSSKEIRAQAKTYNFNDQDDGIMMASSQLNENLIRSYE